MQRVVPFPFWSLLALALWACAALAQERTSVAPATPAPSIEAKAWLLMDLQSGQVIAAHAADERVEPASLTKLMTAYVVFEALQEEQLTLDQRLRVSAKAWKMPGSRMFLEPDTDVTVDELLHEQPTELRNNGKKQSKFY